MMGSLTGGLFGRRAPRPAPVAKTQSSGQLGESGGDRGAAAAAAADQLAAQPPHRSSSGGALPERQLGEGPTSSTLLQLLQASPVWVLQGG